MARRTPGMFEGGTHVWDAMEPRSFPAFDKQLDGIRARSWLADTGYQGWFNKVTGVI